MTPGPVWTHARWLSLSASQNAVMIGVEMVKHLNRPSEELIARDAPIMIGVGAIQHHAAAMAAAAMMVAVFAMRAHGAHFIARQQTVMIGVGLRELRGPPGVEFLARQDIIVIGIGLKQHLRMPAARRGALRLALRQGDARQSADRQRRRRRSQNQLLPHFLHSLHFVVRSMKAR
jgi:hypothetical protein